MILYTLLNNNNNNNPCYFGPITIVNFLPVITFVVSEIKTKSFLNESFSFIILAQPDIINNLIQYVFVKNLITMD